MTDKKNGNQSDVARRLGISRQAVAKLIKNRERTGAPDPSEDGSYDIESFATWYINDFEQKSGPKRGIRAPKKTHIKS